MSTKAIAHDLRCTFTSASEKVSAQDSRRTLPATAQCKFLGLQYIELDQIAGDSVKKDEGKSRFNLWDILFPDRGGETYRGLEGEDMTPVVVYKSGNRYSIADGSSRLAVARYLGQTFILAEVWELP